MAIYHLIMFLTKRKDFSFLIFFLLSVAIITRLVSSDFMAYWFFPNANYDLLMRLSFFSMILTPILVIMFFRYLFYPEKQKSKLLRISLFYFVPVAVFVLFFPVEIFSRFLYLYQFGIIVTSLFALFYLIKAVVNKKEGSFVLLFGASILFLLAINDILYVNGILDTGYLAPVGLVCLIFCQSFVLANRYSKITELYIKDSLTGIYNKRYLFDYIEEKMNFYKNNNEKFSLAILDIDHFKKVNDVHGHDFGDHVLKTISEEISGLLTISENGIKSRLVRARIMLSKQLEGELHERNAKNAS